MMSYLVPRLGLICLLLAPAAVCADQKRPVFKHGGMVSSQNVAELESQKNEALGRELVTNFFYHLSLTGSPDGVIGNSPVDDSSARAQVMRLLDPALVVQRSDGDFETYQSYEPVDIDQFTIKGLRASRPRPDLLVVRYMISVPGSTSLKRGYVSSSEFAPRLSSFRYNHGKRQWLLLSHANFNVPIAQICNFSVKNSGEKNITLVADAEKTKLVQQLLDRLYQEVRSAGRAVAGINGLIINQTEIVSGDGYARDGASGARRLQVGPTQRRNLFFTLSGNDLVVRFEAKNHSVYNNVAFTDAWQPRLASFSRDASGVWRLASFAMFNFPAQPPKGMDCK